MHQLAALRALRIARWAHLRPLCSPDIRPGPKSRDRGQRSYLCAADPAEPVRLSCGRKIAGKSAAQRFSIESGRYFSIIRRKRLLCRSSGPPLGSANNRRSPKNEPLEILAFWRFAFEWRILDFILKGANLVEIIDALGGADGGHMRPLIGALGGAKGAYVAPQVGRIFGLAAIIA